MPCVQGVQFSLWGNRNNQVSRYKKMSKRITTEQKDIALVEYAETGNQKSAALKASVVARTLIREMGRDAAFKDAMEEAKAEYCAGLEKVLNDRVKLGNTNKSDLLLMFLMKKHIPEYREKFEHRVDANVTIISGVPRPK